MKFNAIHIIIYTLFLALLSACELIHDDLPETKAEGAPVYIRLTISTGGEMGTKANPTGGEDGDGREPGETFEDAVNDLYLFFYQVAEGVTDGVNAAADTKIVAYKYFTIGDDYKQYGSNISTAPVEIEGLSVGQTYHVLVVTNVGQELQLEGTNMTLGSLRDDEIKTVWSTSTDGTTYSDFVMTNESDASFTIENNTSPANPTTVSVEVERLAARVDYLAPGSAGQNPFVYETTDGTGTATIEGAALVNKYKSGTYLLKRSVPLDGLASINYLADETEDNDYYVLDPTTISGKSSADFDVYYPTYDTWDKLNWNKPSEDITSTTDGDTYGFLDYTQENIMQVGSGTNWLRQGVTGIVFKAKFVPKNLTLDASGTFYKYKDKLYASEAKIPEGASESEIIEYTNGICYYTYWIKHNNDDDNAVISPMEYAIVRNNIYQLKVTSIAGLGDEEPGDKTLTITVGVKAWNLFETTGIELGKGNE